MSRIATEKENSLRSFLSKQGVSHDFNFCSVRGAVDGKAQRWQFENAEGATLGNDPLIKGSGGRIADQSAIVSDVPQERPRISDHSSARDGE